MEEFEASKPIYWQIVDRINHQIVRGKIQPGEKLPSVREMAIQTGVNPNTVQRTYSELERMGIVETRRGQGTFVTEANEIIVDLKSRLQREIIEAFVINMRDLGYTKEEMITGLKNFIDEEWRG